MSDMEKLLVKVARKVSMDVGSYDEEFQNSVIYRSLVESGVLPLLEAGEAMRRAAQGPATIPIDEQDDEMAHPLFVSLGKWDTALRNAEAKK